MVRIRRILGLPVGNRVSLRPSASLVASTLLLLLTATGIVLAKSPANMTQEPLPADAQNSKRIGNQESLLQAEVEKRRIDREATEAKLAELDEQNATLKARSFLKTVEQINEKAKNVRETISLQRAKDAIDELLRTTDDPVQQKQYQAWLQTLGNKRPIQETLQRAIDNGQLNGGALTDVVPTQIANNAARPFTIFSIPTRAAREFNKSWASVQAIRPNIAIEWQNIDETIANVRVTADTPADLDLLGIVVELVLLKDQFGRQPALNPIITYPFPVRNSPQVASRPDSKLIELPIPDAIKELPETAEPPINQDPFKSSPAVDPSNAPKPLVVVTFPIKNFGAIEMAEAINSVGREFWDADAPKIVADARTNSIIASCTQKQLEQLKALVKLLDKNAAKDLPAETELPQAKDSDIGKKMQVQFFQLELERANLNLNLAKKDFDQVRALHERGTASVQELNRAEHAHDLAQLEQRFAQLKLEAAEQGVELPPK